MPFALLIIGIFLLVAAVRGKEGDLFTLLRSDFTGENNFIYWAVAILAIGMLGYIPRVKPISVALLALVMVVLVLKKGDPSQIGGGFFDKFLAGVKSTTTAQAQAPKTEAASSDTKGKSPSEGLSGILGAVPDLGGLITLIPGL